MAGDRTWKSRMAANAPQARRHRCVPAQRARVARALVLLAFCCLAWRPAWAGTTISVADGDVGGLIGAIADANSETGIYVGQDTIELATGGDYVLTGVNNVTNGQNGLPSITSNVVVHGNGAVIRRSTSGGVPDIRILHVAASGSLQLVAVELRGGRASGQLGGNLYDAGTVTLDGCTIAAGNAGNGGGIYAMGSLTATNSTISGNVASNAGGIFAESAGSATLLNVTVTGNAAVAFGGGLRTFGGATISFTNSIVAGNSAAVGVDCSGGGSGGHNLVGSGTGCAAGGTDQVTANVALELDPTLAANGGPTRTHALIFGSKAIDTGDDAIAPLADQRGMVRQDGDANGTVVSDIGAYELVDSTVFDNGFADDFEIGTTDHWSHTFGG
jgi:hypothetical protein